LKYRWAIVVGGLCWAGCSESAPPEETPNNHDSAGTESEDADCSRAEIEVALEAAIGVIETDVDFSFYIEDGAGNFFAFDRGSSTLDTPYESASTSKWITGTVVMRAVEAGHLSLADTPQDVLDADGWAIAEDAPLYGMTLRQLLSFRHTGAHCPRGRARPGPSEKGTPCSTRSESMCRPGRAVRIRSHPFFH
jgi:CubicO group peptidase (beta-lactamase class C family)